jgi:PKHD-type hydroxylase
LILCIPNVLAPDELQTLQAELKAAAFVDGSTTAGWSAREVKKNLQVNVDSDRLPAMQGIVRNAFLRNGVLQTALLPAAMTQVLFNRYDVGMQYGAHVDAAVMGGMGNAVRSDVAITVFLSDPRSYAGGELVVHTLGMGGEFKLEAGAAIAYPANSLHHVAPVTQGTRHAAVIWVQSQVRDPARRELLWDLDNAKRHVFGREGKSATFDAISKSHANLLRMWTEV